jgi:hypothetical protein
MTVLGFSAADLRQRHKSLTGLFLAAVLAGCAAPPAPVAVKPPPKPEVAIVPQAPPPVVVTPPAAPAAPTVVVPTYVSQASNPRDYRRDAASHLYERLRDRIFKGKMPPMLQAVGVLQVDIDQQGAVTDVRWMRAPNHAPAVMAEIERNVRAAAPYPVPVRMGQVTYTDTWLWHKTGRFQLDTLSEGQL